MLKSGLEQIGFSEEQIGRMFPILENYIHELQLFKQTRNSILGAETYEDIVVRHILDSLAPYKIFCTMIEEIRTTKGDEYEINFADVGSGQGLPGIPLAIAFSEIHFTLIERMTKRTEFLEMAVAKLNLTNVSVNTIELARVQQDSFDVVVFRAFAPFDKKLIRHLLRTLHAGGKLAAYKAKKENITVEMETIKEWASIWKMEELKVPFLEQNQRHLVIIPR